MKTLMVVFAMILVFSFGVYAENTCQSDYGKLLERVQDSIHLSDSDKAQYIEQLDKALKLCEEGDRKQASKIVDELRQKGELKKVFSTLDSH